MARGLIDGFLCRRRRGVRVLEAQFSIWAQPQHLPRLENRLSDFLTINERAIG